MSLVLKGIGVSRGVAIGKAHIIVRGTIEVLESAIPKQFIEDEVRRFISAIGEARQQLEAVRKRIPGNTSADIAAFIDTHLLMLDDDTLFSTPIDMIRERSFNAEWALKLQRDSMIEIFDRMDDPYLRTRKDDVDHVINRVQRILLDTEQDGIQHSSDGLNGAIALTDELTPAEMAILQHQDISAFATEYGGPLSHTAILARGAQIPAIVGAHNLQKYIKDGETIIVDGMQGILIAGPDQDTLAYYEQRQEEECQRRIMLAGIQHDPAITLDKIPVRLMTNIELPEDINHISHEQTQGVGLYRTEFLYMNRQALPDEEEQLQRYIEVIDALKGMPLTIRTLDIGADKDIDSSGTDERCDTNPALGLRAIRLCLKDVSLFRPQLRAILRASAHGPVRLMIPMLTNTREMHQTLALINEIRNELLQEGHPFDPKLPVGGMIEVPAAALSADSFARHLDFLSIGTNDLIQYTLAIDRGDDSVNYLYDPLHPSILRLIKMVIDAGMTAAVPVAMCGEMAGEPRYTRLLLGMGLSEFSMHHSALLEVKQVINHSRISLLTDAVNDILKCDRPQDINSRLEIINRAEH